MTDKIAEIRKRYAFAEENKSAIRPAGFSWTIPGWQAHNDRSYLLAEVDRLRRHVDALQEKVSAESCACGYDSPDAVCLAHSPQLSAALADVERLTRERDEARAALKPFAALFLWPDDVGDEWTVNSIRSGEDWSDEQNDAQLDDKWVRRGDIRSARKALEAKP